VRVCECVRILLSRRSLSFFRAVVVVVRCLHRRRCLLHSDSSYSLDSPGETTARTTHTDKYKRPLKHANIQITTFFNYRFRHPIETLSFKPLSFLAENISIFRFHFNPLTNPTMMSMASAHSFSGNSGEQCRRSLATRPRMPRPRKLRCLLLHIMAWLSLMRV